MIIYYDFLYVVFMVVAVSDSMVDSVFEHNVILKEIHKGENEKITWYCKLNEVCARLAAGTSYVNILILPILILLQYISNTF